MKYKIECEDFNNNGKISKIKVKKLIKMRKS